MQISGFWTIFAFGCAGGFLLELLRWWKLRDSPSFPFYASKPIYWVLTLAMMLAGGFIAAVYGTGPTNALQAINVGAAAPAIIGALAAQPNAGGGGGTKGFDGSSGRPPENRLRRFLAFG